jgi:hypothetical protein
MMFVVTALLGAVIMMHSSFERTTQREKLEVAIRTVTDALCMIDGMPSEAQIERELPIFEQEFELVVIGTGGEEQVIRVIADGRENVERVVMLLNRVNGGEFTLRCKNPAEVRLVKGEQIFMEVV